MSTGHPTETSFPDLVWSDHGEPEQILRLTPELTLSLVAREIRRERTGVHAWLGIVENNGPGERLLESDTFNIGRREERNRLSKAAHGMAGEVTKSFCDLSTLSHALNRFCLFLSTHYEANKFRSTERDPGKRQPELVFPAYPLLIEGGGSLFFGREGKGKSWLLLTLAVCLASRIRDLWPDLVRRNVLYVNLERSQRSIERREAQLCQALGIEGRSYVRYIHARGQPLAALTKSIERDMREHPGSVLLLDSISRAGVGALNEDVTANRSIDTLNGLADTWGAVGHRPKSEGAEMYGNVHFMAGADIGVHLTSQRQQGVLGISLAVTKANDFDAPMDPMYYAYEFSENELVGIRAASSGEFPELAMQRRQSEFQQIMDYVLEHGRGCSADVAQALGIAPSNVTRAFKTDAFVKLTREGQKVFYAARASGE